MLELTFQKYQGAGNDFVIMDNRDGAISLSNAQIEQICDRRFGIGADGLMLLENVEGFDFKMVYYNSDGRESTMCGNGGRCLVKYASTIIDFKNECEFLAIDGPHLAQLTADGEVNLKMIDVSTIETLSMDCFLDTGSPHYILFREDIQAIDIVKEAREIRYNERFKDEGTNVNFVCVTSNEIHIRTYERGVEGETLACGTGVTAAAIAAHFKGLIQKENVPVHAAGGKLNVNFVTQDGSYKEIYLKGLAQKVFEGTICLNI